MKRVFILAVLLLLGNTILMGAAPTLDRATLAVLPFYVDRGIQIQLGNQSISINILETEFANQLMAFLVKSRKFTILDREHIKKVMAENKLTESDYAKPGEDARIGKLLVADYLAIGSIDRLEFVRKRVNINITGENTFRIVATFKINLRVTAVKSGQVVFAQTITQKLTSTDVRREIPVSERKDWTISDFKDLLFKKMTVKAGNAILQGVYPVKIASVQGETVVLNRGQGAGLIVGQKFEVFTQGSIIRDPDTGRELGKEETKTGEIEVTNILAKFSKAKILKMTSQMKVGSICRPISEKQDSEPKPTVPRATPGW